MDPPSPCSLSSEPAADLLASLPPPLLDDILTRLDLGDAVRTSVLSRFWRRRWEALPYIPIPFGTPPLAVDRILVRYPGHISHFSFYLDEHPVTRTADWLIALCNRRVKSIKLQSSRYINLHSSVFLCTQLVYLELTGFCIPPLPVGFTGFPVLEEFNLYEAILPKDGERLLEEILGASPLLNTLTISSLYIDDDDPNELVIGGPNLRNLKIYMDCCYGWQITDLPSLDEATINLEEYASSGFEGFIAGFAQVRKLILDMSYPLPASANGHLMETLPCTFNNLKSLILCTHFCERPAILSTFCLLTNAPNLVELEIAINGDDEMDEIEANAVYQDAQLTDAFCAKLQVVKIDGIGWLPSEMCFIKLVLSKAVGLLTMHLRPYGLISRSNGDALCELMTYRRASPHAQVFFDSEME